MIQMHVAVRLHTTYLQLSDDSYLHILNDWLHSSDALKQAHLGRQEKSIINYKTFQRNFRN